MPMSNVFTCGRDKIAPNLGHLVEHEEEAEKPRYEDVSAQLGDRCVSLGDDCQVGALCAPQRPTSKAHRQTRRYHCVETWIELGGDKRHVGRKRQCYGPLAAQPTATVCY